MPVLLVHGPQGEARSHAGSLCFFQVLGNEESKAQRTNMIVPKLQVSQVKDHPG